MKTTPSSFDIVSTTPNDDGKEGAFEPMSDAEEAHLVGWRLHLATLGIILTLLLINLEVTVVSTSLVDIADEFRAFSKTSWVASAYLATYMGFMVVWSKLSDIVGRKSCFIATVSIFTAFSGACGGSRTLSQLIICRAFQGIGGAGGYSMSTLMTYEMVPKSKLPLYGAINAISVALATVLGPVFGGEINNRTTWRWVFYLNVPAGLAVIAILVLAIPPRFPKISGGNQEMLSLRALWRVDLPGVLLLLGGSLILSAALLETSLNSGWSSGETISLLVMSGICLLCLLTWEWFISMGRLAYDPIFPWKFFYNRSWIGLLVLTFLAGVPFNVVVVFLPQRLQIVSGLSPLNAGMRLLPYTFGAAFGAGIANALGSKRHLAIAHVFLIGGVLQVIGLALFSTLPTSSDFPSKGYSFAVLAGVGMGMSFGMLVLATPFVVDPEELSIASGAIIQFRFLGGIIGLAIGTSVLNMRVKSELSDTLNPSTLGILLQNTKVLGTLTPIEKLKVTRVLAKEYNFQNYILVAFAAAQILAIGLFWNKKWGSRDLIN